MPHKLPILWGFFPDKKLLGTLTIMSALKNYRRQIYLMQQIHEAGYYIKRAEELGHPHLWITYDAILEFLAHFRNALNSYAKCFVSAGSGRTKLEKSIFVADDELLKKHERIMELRHKYLAHSDDNEFETVSVKEINEDNALTLQLQYGISFPFDRLYELRELIKHIGIHIVNRQAAHAAAIEREIGKPVRIKEHEANS
jgi:hypothetical protein